MQTPPCWQRPVSPRVQVQWSLSKCMAYCQDLALEKKQAQKQTELGSGRSRRENEAPCSADLDAFPLEQLQTTPQVLPQPLFVCPLPFCPPLACAQSIFVKDEDKRKKRHGSSL